MVARQPERYSCISVDFRPYTVCSGDNRKTAGCATVGCVC